MVFGFPSFPPAVIFWPLICLSLLHKMIVPDVESFLQSYIGVGSALELSSVNAANKNGFTSSLSETRVAPDLMYGDDSTGGMDCETDHSAQHQLRLRPRTGPRRDLAPASRCPSGHGCDRGLRSGGSP